MIAAPGRRRYSLRTRLLVVASAVLAGFLGLTGLTLDRAFADSVRAAVDERLRGAVYTLLGAANAAADGGLDWPPMLPDPRLSTPESGFYAQVVDAAGRIMWRSPSMVGLQVPFPTPGEVGATRVAELVAPGGRRFFGLSYVIAWEFSDAHIEHYAVQVAEERTSFDVQIAEYRHALWGWLAALAAGLLALQGAVLHWALRPLVRVAAEVRAIETGDQEDLAGAYPLELEALTASLNALIRSARGHLQRYRNAMADLAHSLKTPLAVIRSTLDSDQEPEPRTVLAEQLTRIEQTVDYQLQRAAASGRTVLSAPVAVHAVIERLVASLRKVYAHKAIVFDVQVPAAVRFIGDEGDLIEICGNLLDNACKWCRAAVRVRAAIVPGQGRDGMRLVVEDDGPGIAPAATAAVRRRGVRADERVAGHGIGLAVVHELVEGIYRGRLDIESATGGGARVTVSLPGV